MSNDRWIVAHHRNYYPSITEFDNFGEAKEYFDKLITGTFGIGETVYLASIEEIAEMKMDVSL